MIIFFLTTYSTAVFRLDQGVKGWQCIMRALASHQCITGDTIIYVGLRSVVGSRPCSKMFFSEYCIFSVEGNGTLWST